MRHLSVNAPHVIHETIDGEVIVIDLSTGSYYSLKGSAAETWELIARPSGIAESELLEFLARRFAMSPEDAQDLFAAFLAELADEGLVSEAGSATPPQPTGGARAPSNGRSGRASDAEPPVLEKYTDMQDLVLLDPVHEVDPAGWPQVQPSGEAAA